MVEIAMAKQAHTYEEMGAIFGSLLIAAGIHQLVVIDDSYASNGIDIDAIVVATQTAPDKFIELIPALAHLEADESDRISGIVRGTLEDGTLAQQAWKICQEGADHDAELDAKTMSVLDELVRAIPGSATVKDQRFSGQDWQNHATTVLVPEKGRALVLVDRDFKREGKSEDHGLTVIANILKESPDGVYCALLSHTVSPGDELDRWSTLAEQHGIPQDRFVVISKARLAEEQSDLAGFLHLVRLAILCGPLKNLRDKVRDHLNSAISTTIADLKHWSVFDFDEAIFGSSRKEGVWEGETLLRVMTTFTTRAARRGVLGDADIRQLINFARQASIVRIPLDELHPWKNVGKMALEYQRTELYYEGAYINKNHLPLEAGDVFDRGDDREKYILLAQPCDLMIRGAMGRAYDSESVKMVHLCVIKNEPANGIGQSYELPFWKEDGSSAFVHFPQVHMIRVSILDLCVLDVAGNVTFDRSSVLPETLNVAWSHYVEKLQKQFDTESNRAIQLKTLFTGAASNVPKELRALAIAKVEPCCSNTGRFKSTSNENGFTVNCRRVGRVSSALATDILRAFTRYQSRTAFDQPIFTEDLQRIADTLPQICELQLTTSNPSPSSAPTPPASAGEQPQQPVAV